MPLGSSLREAASWPSVSDSVDFLQPIADLQQRTRCDLVPLGVQAEVMGAVQRSGGIAALSEQQRNAYVDDVGAFVRYPKQTAAFDVWAERVVARTYKKRYEGLEGAPKYEDYFASSILYDEAVASLAARYCRAHPSTLLVCVVSDDHVKFGCSAQGRFQRLEKDPDASDAGSSSARRRYCCPLRGVDRELVAEPAPRAGRRPGEGPPVLRLRLVLAEPASVLTDAHDEPRRRRGVQDRPRAVDADGH